MSAQFPHIISDPEILNGKPCVTGTRISVEMIMDWLGSGGTPESIASKHPLLTKDLVLEAIRSVPFILVAENSGEMVKIRVREF